MDAGRLGYLIKTADPVSPLVILMTPAGVTDMPVPRPRLMVPSETPVFPGERLHDRRRQRRNRRSAGAAARGNRDRCQVDDEAADLHHYRHEASGDAVRDREA